MPIIAAISAFLKLYGIAKIAKLVFTLALIAWFFNWISIPDVMLGFEWPMKEYFAPIFGALGIKKALLMISTAYTMRWTYEAFRLALK